ncbi:hypothetical protein PB2503_09634 [Parvularcula bermudensis HTCC2503]|uniref:S-adenosylmethionine tRNA ribosyltransferase n=1 Tax=Parvularcula bermudensis (strain ATCC BAA-594 / HTCC2503 / KCTC 12087) TaxID=314260 RepID=E0TDR3_PARBH|nr:hypothetical protein PB2503_09634 [Parvularcula bermudensis HTCC2503]
MADERNAAGEAAILALLSTRRQGASICPSEAARVLSDQDWRDPMERGRESGRRLSEDGKIEITKGGVPVSADASGPIRYRLSS